MADLLLEVDAQGYEKLDAEARELFVEYRPRAAGDDDPPVYRRRELVDAEWQSADETAGVVKALRAERERKARAEKEAKRKRRDADELKGVAEYETERLADELTKRREAEKERDQVAKERDELRHREAVRKAADTHGVATVYDGDEPNPAYADLLGRTRLVEGELVVVDDDGTPTLDDQGNPLKVDEYVRALRLASTLNPDDPRARYIAAPSGEGTGSDPGTQGGGAAALRVTGDPLLTTPFTQLNDRQKIELQRLLGDREYLKYVADNV